MSEEETVLVEVPKGATVVAIQVKAEGSVSQGTSPYPVEMNESLVNGEGE